MNLDKLASGDEIDLASDIDIDLITLFLSLEIQKARPVNLNSLLNTDVDPVGTENPVFD